MGDAEEGWFPRSTLVMCPLTPINPMHPDGYPNLTGDPRNAPRCGARTRAGLSCQNPAIRHKRRCRMHGGKGSGAPRDNQNAVKSGRYRCQPRASRWMIRAVLSMALGRRYVRRDKTWTERDMRALRKALVRFGMEGVADDLGLPD